MGRVGCACSGCAVFAHHDAGEKRFLKVVQVLKVFLRVQLDEEELWRLDVDGVPHYSPLEQLEGEVVRQNQVCE